MDQDSKFYSISDAFDLCVCVCVWGGGGVTLSFFLLCIRQSFQPNPAQVRQNMPLPLLFFLSFLSSFLFPSYLLSLSVWDYIYILIVAVFTVALDHIQGHKHTL